MPAVVERVSGSTSVTSTASHEIANFRSRSSCVTGRVTVPAGRPAVFSPFGLGVLDLAVAKYVYDEVSRSGDLHVVDDFFHELRRYG
jgi:ornithine cyclodeaminase/alanine dehydrogenase-like protein (mu-crystallin family)